MRVLCCTLLDSYKVLGFWIVLRNMEMKKRTHFILARALVGSQIYDNIREPYWGLRVDDYYLQRFSEEDIM